MSGKSSRAKGHRYELELVNKFKEFFPDCVTSRSESKRTDDAGVDLCYTGGFNVQAKNWEKAPAYHDALAKMPKDKLNLLFHRRNRKGSVVVMSEEDFWVLFGGYMNG